MTDHQVATETMFAITRDGYGSPSDLAHTRVPIPDIGPDEVLVRNRASSINAKEWHLLTGEPVLLRPMLPKGPVLGSDVAGTVAALGSAVTDYAVGDEVFGEVEMGAFAEYVVAATSAIAPKPASLTFEQAGAIPLAAVTALQGLRDGGGLRPGDSVLINGASGGVGTFAVQIAKALGAEVTAVCHTRNIENAAALGADHVIDYTREDFTELSPRYASILDMVGTRPWRQVRRALEEGGTYVAIGGPKGRWAGPLPHMVVLTVASLVGTRSAKFLLAHTNSAELRTLTDLVDSGHLSPFIEADFSLADVPEALQRQGAGHARGKTVITI